MLVHILFFLDVLCIPKGWACHNHFNGYLLWSLDWHGSWCFDFLLGIIIQQSKLRNNHIPKLNGWKENSLQKCILLVTSSSLPNSPPLGGPMAHGNTFPWRYFILNKISPLNPWVQSSSCYCITGDGSIRSALTDEFSWQTANFFPFTTRIWIILRMLRASSPVHVINHWEVILHLVNITPKGFVQHVPLQCV